MWIIYLVISDNLCWNLRYLFQQFVFWLCGLLLFCYKVNTCEIQCIKKKEFQARLFNFGSNMPH